MKTEKILLLPSENWSRLIDIYESAENSALADVVSLTEKAKQVPARREIFLAEAKARNSDAIFYNSRVRIYREARDAYRNRQ